MFDLVRSYDARFYIVADRYEYPGTNRTMEVRLYFINASMRV